MFKRPFSFNGRIRKTEYCLSFLIYMIWCVLINAMIEPQDPSVGASVFVLISFIPMLWFLWAQNVKRCHDRGNSGWNQLYPFISLFFYLEEMVKVLTNTVIIQKNKNIICQVN